MQNNGKMLLEAEYWILSKIGVQSYGDLRQPTTLAQLVL